MSSAGSDKSLEKLRADLRDLDRRILDLIAQRMEICGRIGKIKRETGRDITDSAREAENLRQNKTHASDHLPGAMIEELTDLLVNWSKKAQNKP